MSAAIGAFAIDWDADSPAALVVGDGRPVPFIEIFTAEEQRARTSQAYVRSAVGARLRVAAVNATDHEVIVRQREEQSGLEIRSILTLSGGALRAQHEIRGTREQPIVLTAVSTLTFGLGADAGSAVGAELVTARSEWLAENRWRRRPLTDELPPLSLGIHAQDGRGHAVLTSHGAWPTGEHLPVGAIVTASGETVAWQIESGAGWHVDLSQGLDGVTISLLGPADLEHQFAHVLSAGNVFTTVPVAIAVGTDFDEAFAGLTAHRRATRQAGPTELPIVYNDFMNTLMGQPSSEALRPLIRAAADAGAEIFCIDAGWFADPEAGDWWDTVGEWREASARFDQAGLRGLIEEIHAAGMRSGLWIEPEVVGVRSPAAATLPEAAFFHRFGTRVREHDRYHLDFRHPAARAHLDEVVDRLVRDYGVGFLKLDYNINPGAGTEDDAAAAGAGLLGHVRAFGEWLDSIAARHPALLIENCASGAMRADYALLSRTHMQSTSDQQDFLFYPPIAASAPASVLPEQCGNWAYPAAEMTDAETAFTLVTGLSGRLYLSGFLGSLRESQRELVREAVTVHKSLRHVLRTATAFWPSGLPEWDDDAVCLGLRDGEDTLLFVWDRAEHPQSFVLAGAVGEFEQLFPGGDSSWTVEPVAGGLRVETGAGVSARVLRRRGATA